MSAWRTAGDIPGLVELVPPPPVGRAIASSAKVDDYARALRVVVLGLGSCVVFAMTAETLTYVGYGWLYWTEAITRAALIFYAARRAGFGLAPLWAVAGLAPLLWLAVLVVLHQRLYRRLTNAGYRVSFLGRVTPPAGRPAAGSPHGGTA